MMLQLHPKTNALGVCDWTFEKINAYTHGNTPTLFQQAGRELVNEGLLVIDEDTEEALLLDHIDLTADSGTIESAYLGTASPRLRRILVSELNRTLRQENTSRSSGRRFTTSAESRTRTPTNMRSRIQTRNPSRMIP